MEMNKEMLMSLMEEHLVDYLPDQYKDCQVKFNTSYKDNRELTAVLLVRNTEGTNISPTIYVEDILKNNKGSNYMDLVKHSADVIANAMEVAKELEKEHIERIYDTARIIPDLINTKANQKLLEGVPSRPFHDLSVTYRVIIDNTDTGRMSTRVTNQLAEKMGLSEEDLYKIAIENLPKIDPPKLASMKETMRGVFAKEGMPEEVIDAMLEDVPENGMSVLTSESGLSGPAYMLIPEVMDKVCELVGESKVNFIGSSNKEVIAVPYSLATPEALGEMEAEVNLSTVAIEDRLTNEIYTYDSDTKEHIQATDNKDVELFPELAVAEKDKDYNKSNDVRK